MKEVIISAYDRDYSWINSLNKDVVPVVYRKGNKNNNSTEIFIDNNVGRDVHTFFYHFVINYDNLSKYTFTSQDFFQDHVSNYIDIINGTINTYKKYAIQDFGGCWFFNDDWGRVLSCDKNGIPHHPGLDIASIWYKLFNDNIPDTIYFTPAGHFCITNEHLKLKPKKFYENILNILETNEHAPWIIERLEPYIFNPEYNNIKL